MGIDNHSVACADKIGSRFILVSKGWWSAMILKSICPVCKKEFEVFDMPIMGGTLGGICTECTMSFMAAVVVAGMVMDIVKTSFDEKRDTNDCKKKD